MGVVFGGGVGVVLDALVGRSTFGDSEPILEILPENGGGL